MQQSIIRIGDKSFKLYISEREIMKAISHIAEKISSDFRSSTPLIIPILNGSFMFASDLMKELTCPCEISFIKAASYKGTQTSGELASLIGLSEDIKGKDIIILEDIIDTGNTLSKVIPSFEVLQPASIRVATLLFKPQALKHNIKIDYVGMEIPNDFIIGYGLDYNGLGRNLREIYQVVE